MAVDFSSNWASEIASITESSDYQTCEIRINWDPTVLDVYDYTTNEMFAVTAEVNAIGLSLIGFQRVIDNVNSTPQEVSDAQADFVTASGLLRAELGVEGTPSVTVSPTVPTVPVGSLWVRQVDEYAVVSELAPSGWAVAPVDTVVYSGRARFIPVRAGVWQGGEAQLNATTIRAVRFQLPRSEMATRIHAGAIVTITSAPFNPNLNGRTAKVDDDFQGATTATRTFHAMMDADSEDVS